MANSIDVGCESGGDVNDSLKALFEAVKAKGNMLPKNGANSINVGRIQRNQILLTAFNFELKYYVQFLGFFSRGDIYAPLSEEIEQENKIFQYYTYYDVSQNQLYYNIYIRQGNSVYFDDYADLYSIYYIYADSYNDLMSQLGGGIKPYYILSPIIILEVREYGKQCRYWVRR